MVHLRYIGSPWYAFSRADEGAGEDAVLTIRHRDGAAAQVTAGELWRAGCEERPERLRAFLAGRWGDDEAKSATAAAMHDIDSLAPAVDRFLVEVDQAGKLPMPPGVARRYRELRRWIDEALVDPGAR